MNARTNLLTRAFHLQWRDRTDESGWALAHIEPAKRLELDKDDGDRRMCDLALKSTQIVNFSTGDAEKLEYHLEVALTRVRKLL